MDRVMSLEERVRGKTEIEEKIRDFVARNILYREEGFPHSDDASFLGEGVIDSLGVLELATFVGREFGLKVELNEVTPQNFDSVSRLAAYVRRKQEGSARACYAGS